MKKNKPFFSNPACADVDVNIFFAKDPDEPGYVNSELEYRQAKKICMGCKHITECAEWGIENEIYGMWGGLTPRERQRIRRRQRRKPPIGLTA